MKKHSGFENLFLNLSIPLHCLYHSPPCTVFMAESAKILRLNTVFPESSSPLFSVYPVLSIFNF